MFGLVSKSRLEQEENVNKQLQREIISLTHKLKNKEAELEKSKDTRKEMKDRISYLDFMVRKYKEERGKLPGGKELKHEVDSKIKLDKETDINWDMVPIVNQLDWLQKTTTSNRKSLAKAIFAEHQLELKKKYTNSISEGRTGMSVELELSERYTKLIQSYTITDRGLMDKALFDIVQDIYKNVTKVMFFTRVVRNSDNSNVPVIYSNTSSKILYKIEWGTEEENTK